MKRQSQRGRERKTNLLVDYLQLTRIGKRFEWSERIWYVDVKLVPLLRRGAIKSVAMREKIKNRQAIKMKGRMREKVWSYCIS